MSRRVRTLVFLLGALGMGTLIVLVILRMPSFGASAHPYRDLATAAAIRHSTPNVVSSVNFDQRALDTLGEETILLGSVLGAAALLRPDRRERERRVPAEGRVLPSTALLGLVLLPVTTLIGIDVVAHGHLTPGGGFQGGVVLATGLHLAYISGSYPVLQRIRPLGWYEYGEAVGAGAFAVLGVIGLAVSGSVLTNFLPLGRFEQPLAAGTVPLLNFATGCEVASGVVVLLAQFLHQAIALRDGPV